MTQDEAKRMAARRALEFVEDGMLLGLGSGSTSRMFIQELGERVKQGLRVRGIATSTSSRELAESLSIPIITICAMIVLMIFLILLNIIFFWLPFFKICFPVPTLKAK